MASFLEPTDKTQRLTKKVPEEQLGLTRKVFKRATEGLNQVPTGVYEGARVAPVTGDTRTSRALMRSAADDMLSTNPLRRLARQTARGDFLHPDSNPFLRGTIDAAVRPIQESLMERALPSIQSASVAGGAFGGNREDLIELAALRDAERAAGDVGSQIAFENLARERVLQTQAPNMFAQIGQLEMLPGQIYGQLGASREARAQAELDARRQRFEESRRAPFSGLAETAPLVLNTLPGTTQVATSESGSGAGNFLKGAIGLGAGGAVLANQLGLFEGLGFDSGAGDWLKALSLPLGGAALGGVASIL